MKTLSSKAVTHNNQPYWAIDFKYDSKLIAELKKLPGTRWSKTHNRWLVKLYVVRTKWTKRAFI